MTPPDSPKRQVSTVLTVFGTRPEVIKLAPVVAELKRHPRHFRSVVVSSGQHVELLEPFVAQFGLTIDHNLGVMRSGQHLNQLFARVMKSIDPILDSVRPDVVLVQGDTTTAVASALAAFHRRIPVGHVEAGLRTNDPLSPFPEEMNRRVITRIARWHFAGTHNNVEALRREGVWRSEIFRTGNPVVDALRWLGKRSKISERLQSILQATAGLKRITVTTHRRENFAGTLEQNLRVLKSFVERHKDTALIFPMHPNPIVREKAYSVLTGCERVILTDPFDYPDFIGMLRNSWLIASDSGGVQEEAPSLGVPLIVLRESTERPEAVDCGAATLAPTPELFAQLLDRVYSSASVSSEASSPLPNPFGDGRAARRIVRVLHRQLHQRTADIREVMG